MIDEQTSVADLRAQVARVAELRALEAEASNMKKTITDQLETEEAKILKMLTDNDLKQFRCEHGLVSIGYFTSVKTPKTPEDRDAFFAWLKQKGVFMDTITVHSATLNALYKSEMEIAIQRGDVDFKIPGISEETITERLSFRKA
jgi:hypothetical protein